MKVRNNPEQDPNPNPPAPPEPPAPKMKNVDIFGVSVDLPEEVANKVISVRDQKTQEFNSVISEKQQKEMESQEKQRKIDALEAAKAGEAEKAEELFTQKYQEKISRYEQHTYRSAVKAALASRTDLVPGAADDALTAIMSSNEFVLTEDFQVKAGDKDVDSLVNDFIDARDYLKVSGSRSQDLPNNPTKPTPKKATGRDAIKNGLDKILG